MIFSTCGEFKIDTKFLTEDSDNFINFFQQLWRIIPFHLFQKFNRVKILCVQD